MTTFVLRDLSLDLDLESGAHLILILIAIGLAFLLMTTAITFYLFPVCRILRRAFLRRQMQNSATVNTNTEVFQLTMSSTPTRKPVVLPLVQSHLQHQQLGLASPTQRSPATVRKYPTVSHRPTAVYNSTNYGFRQASLTASPQPGFGQSPHSTYRALPLQAGVSPHIAGWMRVADSIVGSHPFAQALGARVATQAEIDLISGHVYIPWALDRPKSSQPAQVKLQRPDTINPSQHRVHPDHSASSQQSEGAFLVSTFLREQLNASSPNNHAVRDKSTLLGFVRNNAEKVATKSKAIGTTRGKENKLSVTRPSFSVSRSGSN